MGEEEAWVKWCDRGEVREEREETWEGDKHRREKEIN